MWRAIICTAVLLWGFGASAQGSGTGGGVFGPGGPGGGGGSITKCYIGSSAGASQQVFPAGSCRPSPLHGDVFQALDAVSAGDCGVGGGAKTASCCWDTSVVAAHKWVPCSSGLAALVNDPDPTVSSTLKIAANNIQFANSGFTSLIGSASLTGNRVLTVPNKSGTLIVGETTTIDGLSKEITNLAAPTAATSAARRITLTGGTGIAAIGDISTDRTIDVDTTEIGTTTWGSNATIVWSFDDSAAASSTLTVSGGNIILDPGGLNTTQNHVAIMGETLTGLGLTQLRFTGADASDGNYIELRALAYTGAVTVQLPNVSGTLVVPSLSSVTWGANAPVTWSFDDDAVGTSAFIFSGGGITTEIQNGTQSYRALAGSGDSKNRIRFEGTAAGDGNYIQLTHATVAGGTGAQTIEFPNLTGTVMLTSGNQTVGGKTFDATNVMSGTSITSGTVAAARIDAAMATDAELAGHTGATTAVHGVAGAVVGTSDSQTLTNKTINASLNTITNLSFANLAPLTASRAVVTNGSGVVVAATTTAAQIGYLSDVTSNIQAQLDAKPDAGALLSSSSVVFRNGSQSWTGQMDAGGFKLTNLAPGTASGDAVRYSQLQESQGFFLAALSSKANLSDLQNADVPYLRSTFVPTNVGALPRAVDLVTVAGPDIATSSLNSRDVVGVPTTALRMCVQVREDLTGNEGCKLVLMKSGTAVPAFSLDIGSSALDQAGEALCASGNENFTASQYYQLQLQAPTSGQCPAGGGSCACLAAAFSAEARVWIRRQ